MRYHRRTDSRTALAGDPEPDATRCKESEWSTAVVDESFLASAPRLWGVEKFGRERPP